jgi:hypothetical protein
LALGVLTALGGAQQRPYDRKAQLGQRSCGRLSSRLIVPPFRQSLFFSPAHAVDGTLALEPEDRIFCGSAIAGRTPSGFSRCRRQRCQENQERQEL